MLNSLDTVSQSNHQIWNRWISVILLSMLLTACTLSSGDTPQQVATEVPSASPLAQVLPNRTLVAINTPTSAAPVAIQVATAIPSPTSVPSTIRDGISGTESHIYVRVGPSTMSTIFTQVNDLASLEPVGRTEDERWLQVRLADQRNGWIMAEAIRIEGDITSLPVTGLPNYVERVVLVAAETGGISLLQVPNSDVEIASLEPLAPLQVVGRNDTSDWLFVETNTTLEGWVRAADLVLPFLPQQVQIIPAEMLVVSTSTPSSSVVVQSPIGEEEANAKVRDDAGGLRLRQLPNPDGTILFNLQSGTPLLVSERTTDSAWVYVTIPEGFEGWLATSFLDLSVELALIPQTDNPQAAPYFELEAPESAPSVISGVTGGARQIYLRGQQLGNRRNVFTMIGDSLTDTEMFMRSIPGGYNLRDYGYLLPAIQFFNVDTGYGNAFARDPFSAEAGWVTFSTLDTNNTPTDICDPGWAPLDCEFRLIRALGGSDYDRHERCGLAACW